MSLVVATNVSSLTAQRALAYADSLQGEAMQRLSTGSKINSASDDAAGLAMAQRMTAQVNGLNMAVKNANDGISMTQSIEGALVETADMLQRLRELAVQASNDTNTGVDRSAIQEEVDLIIAEITRISSNTRYNNQKVLDGSFVNRQLQVGTEGGETINVSVDSSAADKLGSFVITGDRIETRLGNGGGISANATAATDDFIINGKGESKTIDVAAKDSAMQVAAKVNAVSGETGVTAEAKTYALLYSEFATDKTASVRVNGTTTGEFVISSTSVSDAVRAINNISGSTGVTATATSDNKVRLYSSSGEDISIENESSLTDGGAAITPLKVQTVGHDGSNVMPSKMFHRATALDSSTMAANKDITGDSRGALDGTYTLVHRATGQTYSFTLNDADSDGAATATELKTALNNIAGVSGFEVKSVDNDDGTNLTTGQNSTFRVTSTEAFGDFDIYSGNDISLDAQRQTFVGIAGVKHMTNMDLASNTTYKLVNNSTGEIHEFSVPDITDNVGDDTTTTLGIHKTGKIDADELEAALNSIEGVSGFSVHVAGTPASADEPVYEHTTFTIANTEMANTDEIRLSFHNGTSQVHIDVTQNATATIDSLKTLLEADANFDASVIQLTKVDANNLLVEYLTPGDKTGSLAMLSSDTGTSPATGALASAATAVAGVDGTRTNEFIIHGHADFGDFTIQDNLGSVVTGLANGVVGDKNAFDVTLASGNSTNDTATVQGTVSLSSSNLFTVSQSDEYTNTGSVQVDSGSNTTKDDSTAPGAAIDMRSATGSLFNDNYFTSQAAIQKTVDNVNLRTQVGASDALKVIDGAIEKVSSMRSSLGAIENRLDHTVNNLMNVSEQTESARSRIQDADFAAESAKLSKAQVLKQAGVGMLAQANASSQLVLQLLQ